MGRIGAGSAAAKAHRRGIDERVRWLCRSLATVGLCLAAGVVRGGEPVGGWAEPIEEVVVTARKVEERAQDVPASLQVLSGEHLDAVDLSRFYELQFEVPGLVVNSLGLFGAGFALRGITDQGGGSLAVATHLNGAYLGSANLAVARLFDLERIEVLKGPQGTLYGRNATGGSINLVTRAPGDQFDAGLEGAYGSFETRRLQGYLNIPYNTAAFRVTFIGSEGDGYLRNSVDAREFGESDFHGIRAAARLQPSARLRIDLMAQRLVDDGAAGELWSPNQAYLPDPDDIQLTTVTHEDPFLRTDADFVTANLAYDLAFAKLHSVTAFADSEVRNVDDCAGLPVLAGCVRAARPLRHRQWSQEFRLAAPAGGPARWVIGTYFYDADERSRYSFAAPRLNPDPINDSTATAAETDYAAFGEVGLPIAEQWSMTWGLRLSRDRQRVTSIGTGTADYSTLMRADDRWSNTSWRWVLEYAPDLDKRWYASVSTGFKSGGISTERLPSGEFDGYDPEDLIAYEVGLKQQSAAGRWRLDVAAFFYDFADMQVRTTVLANEQVISVLDNAARAEIYGIDGAGSFQFHDRLTLSAGLVWMPRREFVEFEGAVSQDDLSGNEISRAPEWSATATLRYQQPIGGGGELSASLQYDFRSDFFFTKENVPNMSQPDFGLWNLSLRLEPLGQRWYLFASGRNLAGEDYFNQAFIQSSPGYPDTYEAGFGVRF